MSPEKVPRDKNGRPLKDAFLFRVELNGVGPPRFIQATLEVAGLEKSTVKDLTVKDLKGGYYVVDNSKIENIE